ncbi:flagellar protein FlaG [Anoxybacillus rupiensis]|uniref:Flagellar protein FlaG n=1 Tax=Anoxybacteroides rupiense TaxID=311460 RepID=A0ABD5IV18_9BACL|nr:flagellar protein FlaG [Anoxybacillus rupiensis]MDE8564467.1 flagellar protein FlaG [Anoxybacillus rupiensis]MED5051718.1 flagellar protein FlaG [Anoxybacillus rupiensis]
MAIERIFSQSSFSLENVKNQQAFHMAERQPTEEPIIAETSQDSQEWSKDRLSDIVKSMNTFLQPSQTSLRFELHDELKEYYVQVVDERTKEVIREIPPKKLLDMYAAMMEFVGLVVDKKI